MIPIGDSLQLRTRPIITLTLVALNVLIYVWDRGGNLLGSSVIFSDLVMRPREVVLAIIGQGNPSSLGTLFTSMFLHANWMHLLANMLFLGAFGANVEHAVGPWRFGLYYLAWGLVASAAQIWVDPNSSTPVLGASGAIGGVLGCYFLLFPSNRIVFIVPPLFFLPLALPAWILLGGWFLFQILFPQMGVANWAHAGGFMAGLATVLLLGGRTKILNKASAPFARFTEVDDLA